MSAPDALDLTIDARGTLMSVRAQPNARRVGILGTHAGAIRIGVTVAPEQGKANAALADVLAAIVGVRPSQVVLLSGETSRDKRFLILNAEPDTLRGRIEAALEAI